MADVITRLKVESSEYDSKIKRATQSLNEMTTAAEREGNKIATANKENIALAQSLGKMATVSTTARGKMSELSAAIESATIQYNRLSAAEKQGQFGRGLNASITQLQGRLKGLQGEMAAVQGNMGGLGKGGGITSGLGGALASFTPVGLAAAGVAAAVGGVKKVFTDMIEINKAFEQSSANLAAVMGTSRDQITALTNQAKQLGATTQYTATQILDLQTSLARLGFTQQEIVNSTKSVQALATATGSELGQAAELAGASLRAFGLNATEMERVASVLAVSTTKSALSFDKLATAMPIVAPVAKQAGFTIEDTVTLLGKLSDAGMDASMSANSIKSIFLKLADSGSALSKAIGHPVRNVEELGSALVELKSKGIDLNTMLELTDKRAVTAFGTLIDGAETLGTLKESITDCSDALQGMVDEQMDTLEGSSKKLQSAWEGLMLEFEDTGALQKVKEGLADVLGYVTKLNKLNSGGEKAISVYAQDLSAADKKTLNAGIDKAREGGLSDADIKTAAESTTEKLKKERDGMVALLSELEKAKQSWTPESDVKKLLPALQETFGEDIYSKWTGVDGEAIYKKVAEKDKEISKFEYIASRTTEAKTEDVAWEKQKEEEKRTKEAIKLKKAQYEEQEKIQIAALKKGEMSEDEYAAAVYDIRKNTLQKIANLYEEGTAERAMANTRVLSLNIEQQGRKTAANSTPEQEAQKKISELTAEALTADESRKEAIRQQIAGLQAQVKEYEKIKNYVLGIKEKEKKTITGPSGYSQEGISAFRSEIQGSMKGMQMGSDEYMFQAERLVDLTTFENLMKTAVANGIQIDPATLETLFEGIDNAEFGVTPSVSDEAWQTLVDQINEKLADLGLDPIELDVKTGGVSVDDEAKKVKGLGDGWNSVASAIGTVSGALQGLEDPSAKIAGIIGQAVANIALSFAEAAASPAVTGTGWGWLGFAASGIATMIATISSIKQATAGSYANGGIVPGNSYSGDNLTANVNSGELILSRAQSDSIAGQLQGGATQTVVVEGRISGKDILLSANNTNRAAGGSRGYYTKLH